MDMLEERKMDVSTFYTGYTFHCDTSIYCVYTLLFHFYCLILNVRLHERIVFMGWANGADLIRAHVLAGFFFFGKYLWQKKLSAMNNKIARINQIHFI